MDRKKNEIDHISNFIMKSSEMNTSSKLTVQVSSNKINEDWKQNELDHLIDLFDKSTTKWQGDLKAFVWQCTMTEWFLTRSLVEYYGWWEYRRCDLLHVTHRKKIIKRIQQVAKCQQNNWREFSHTFDGIR